MSGHANSYYSVDKIHENMMHFSSAGSGDNFLDRVRVTEWQSNQMTAWQFNSLTEWQSDSVTEWQSDRDRVIEWQNDRVTVWQSQWQSDGVLEWQSDRMTGWQRQNNKVIEWQSDRMTECEDRFDTHLIVIITFSSEVWTYGIENNHWSCADPRNYHSNVLYCNWGSNWLIFDGIQCYAYLPRNKPHIWLFGYV